MVKMITYRTGKVVRLWIVAPNLMINIKLIHNYFLTFIIQIKKRLRQFG
jgi:hypothetical protein